LTGLRRGLEAAMMWRRGQAYGQDLRDRVLAAQDLSVRAAAARFAVSPSYVVKVRARLRQMGEATPGPQHNHVPPRLASLEAALRARVAAGCDATLAELRSWLWAEYGVRISHPVLWQTLRRLDLTLKKEAAARRRAGPCRHRRRAPGLGRDGSRTGPSPPGLSR
jgi:transposase